MNLAVETETLATDQNMSWLASKHGTDAVGNADGLLDGTALLAIYSDGFAKAGTILARTAPRAVMCNSMKSPRPVRSPSAYATRAGRRPLGDNPLPLPPL
jgi:hypothetical protein